MAPFRYKASKVDILPDASAAPQLSVSMTLGIERQAAAPIPCKNLKNIKISKGTFKDAKNPPNEKRAAPNINTLRLPIMSDKGPQNNWETQIAIK